jgi:hypothetical protein
MVISFGNLNGAVSSNIVRPASHFSLLVLNEFDHPQYRARDKPWYTLGHGIVLLYIGMGLLSALAFIVLLRRENGRRERGERDEVVDGVKIDGEGEKEREERGRRNGRFASWEEAKKMKGDGVSTYRYTI